jgi:ribonuclease-3
MNTDLSTLEKKISVVFENKVLLKNIFIHRSYLNEHRSFELPSNEKLEFLGDSVLSLATSIYLYQNYPELTEGDYTDIKAAIVRTESLAEVSRALDLGSYLYLSKGEEKGGGREKMNILADCFEALIAGISIDKDFDTAFHFIHTYLFQQKLKYLVDNKLYLSPKSRLQEVTQAKYKNLPAYEVINSTGPEHQKLFKVDAVINGKIVGVGSGKSKKQAEENAAQNALEKIR